MSGPLRVLIVEDSEDDALLVVRELRKGGYDPVHERVDSPEELAAALHGKTWDIVLSDYSMPRFSGPAALKIVRETDLDIPFIMISGKIGEETAVDAMKAGAHDYVMKDKLKRLIPSVKRELGEAESRRKRRKAEQALLQSESRFFAVFHYSPVPMALGSLDDGRLLDVNKEYLHVTEYSRGELIGHTVTELNLWLNPGDRETLIQSLRQNKGIVSGYPVSVRTKSGKIVDVLFSAVIVMINDAPHLLSTAIDVTDRKAAQEREELAKEILKVLNEASEREDLIAGILALIKNRTPIEAVGIRLREGDDYPYYSTNGFPGPFVKMETSLCARDPHGALIHDAQGNPVLECLCGNVIAGRTDPSPSLFTEYGSFWTNSTSRLLASATDDNRLPRMRNTCGKEGYESVALIPLRSAEGIIGLLQLNDRRPDRFTIEMIRFFEGLGASIGIAVDRRKKADLLRKAEEKYRSIFENAQEGIFQTTPGGRYLSVNHALAAMLGYASPEELMSSVTDVGHQLFVNPDDRMILLKRLDKQGAVTGFETQYYRKDGSVIWVSVNQRAVRDADGRVLYYDGFDQEITARKLSLERLRKALGATVQAIATVVETRDPYTAGHQKKVADLARAIATEMNLDRERIDGIRMASMIHDIGKISVPAEILSKPTKLTDLEFSLIKIHAQSGYDILKDIEFPWPIARMVLEHHERTDGSGYPNGITGEDTLLDSRILSVADVVESMVSHRPYRAALGQEKALEEIALHRGRLYDPDVVDACLRLFEEKGYRVAD